MIKVTTIVDNHALPDMKAEHGYSLCIEAENSKILFDTGQGHAFRENIAILKIDLEQIDLLIMSHGHYDHTGNLQWFLKNNSHARVYSLQGFEEPRYRKRENGFMKEIGMTAINRQAFLELPAWRKCQPETEPTQPLYVLPRIGLTGEVPRISPYEPPEKYFFLDNEAEKPDPVKDDNSFWIETETGIILFCGCCHAGLINTISVIKNFLGDRFRLRGVIGGMHLADTTRARLDKTVEFLNQLEPEFIIPAHCTGSTLVQSLFKPEIRLFESAAGKIFEFSEQGNCEL